MSDYFTRLVAETPSRVWVNNPTVEEISLAQARGAVGCTTNPGYGGNLVKRAPHQVLPFVDAVLAEHPDGSDRAVADHVQERLVGRIAAAFRPLFESSRGRAGFVSIQGSPETDTDGERIWEEAQSGKAIAPNTAPKIPATPAGFVAFERVVSRGWPTIITEVFSVDQVVSACEIYNRVTAKTGIRSPFFMSPITGILGDHLKKLAKRDGLDVSARTMDWAGIGIARRCAAIVEERKYAVTLLFGGARIPEDLTGLMGAAHHATINWSTFAEVIESDPPLERTIDRSLDPDMERTLLVTFPDVWKGWDLGRLAPEEYAAFGPVQHFRDNFLDGWHSVLAMIATRRRELEGGCAGAGGAIPE
jgi:transaldolase